MNGGNRAQTSSSSSLSSSSSSAGENQHLDIRRGEEESDIRSTIRSPSVFVAPVGGAASPYAGQSSSSSRHSPSTGGSLGPGVGGGSGGGSGEGSGSSVGYSPLNETTGASSTYSNPTSSSFTPSRLPFFTGTVRSSYRTSGSPSSQAAVNDQSGALAAAGSSGASAASHSFLSSSHTRSSSSSSSTAATQSPSSSWNTKMSAPPPSDTNRKRKASPGSSASAYNNNYGHRASSSRSGSDHSSPAIDVLAGLAAAAASGSDVHVNGTPQGSTLSANAAAAAAAAAASAAQAATKRIKTARACDSCRRKKIRCDVIDDGGPILGDPNNGNGGLTCAHCRQYGFDCTFFLPITETRFKKKREREAEEMAAAAAAAAAASRAHMNSSILPPPIHHGIHHSSSLSHPHLHHHPQQQQHPVSRSISLSNTLSPYSGAPHTSTISMPSTASHMSLSPSAQMPLRSAPILSSYNKTAHLDVPPVRISSTQEWPRAGDSALDRSSPSHHLRQSHLRHSDASSSSSSLPKDWQPRASKMSNSARQSADSPTETVHDDNPPPGDIRVLGPTSIAYIVHSTAFVPGAAIEEHDLRHHQTFEVGASGNGIIKFHKPPPKSLTAKGASNGDDADELAEDVVRLPDSLRGRLAGDVAEKLVNTYFEKLGYLFPVVTKSEFLHMSPPPPLLLYTICGIAALSREVPKEVLSSIKTTLNSLFRDNDILSLSNVSNVKTLLIMSLHSDVHGSTAVQAGSRCWNRVGSAIRMAQDLGLHRDASGRDDLDDDAFFLEQKRRIWGCCVTADRCMSISLGHPMAIDLTDCDVRLPSPHEILRFASDIPSLPGVDRPFAFNAEMLKLTILFGRVTKTIYSPTGLMKVTDEEIVGLLNDIDNWRDMLPAALQFRGAKETPAPAGILHISYACLVHLFFRVFMRISYNCPQHLTFSLTIERMTMLIKITRESIDWVDLNDFYLDTMQFVSYGLVFCATVQYHAWIRRKEIEALASLKRAADCVARFKRPGESESMEDLSMRAKTAEVIVLLHKSAIGSYSNTPNSGNLNPTAGVTNRRWTDTVDGIVFKPDQSRPGGGVYVATKHNLMLDDLPQGTMVLQETDQGAVPALVRTNAESNGGWRTLGTAGVDVDGAQRSINGGDTDATRNLTHVAGDVWADAEGRPVDRQGARLLTMIPVPGGDALIQSFPGGPRLSFSSIAGGIAPPSMMANCSQDTRMASAAAAAAAAAAATAAAAARGGEQASVNASNEAAWLSAMAAQAASANAGSDGVPPTFNFSDLYTFDGQIAQPAAMLHDAQIGGKSTVGSSSSTAAYAFPGNDGDANSMIGDAGGSVDPLALDGMPGGPLDFAAWEQWFRGAAPMASTADGSG